MAVVPVAQDPARPACHGVTSNSSSGDLQVTTDEERSVTRHVNSYDRDAKLPTIGSRWVWEIDSPGARSLIEVIEVIWNGEEWWIRTNALIPNRFPSPGVCLNDLSRFHEACTPVGGSRKGLWTTHQVRDGEEWRQDERLADSLSPKEPTP